MQEVRLLKGLRSMGVKNVERAIVGLFSSKLPWLSEKLEEEITGSLAVYMRTVNGVAVFSLAYDRGGTEFPTFLEGWWGYSVVEIERALDIVKRWIDLITCPFVVSEYPLNPRWLGWGPTQAKKYLDTFHVCACVAFAGLESSDETGVG